MLAVCSLLRAVVAVGEYRRTPSAAGSSQGGQVLVVFAGPELEGIERGVLEIKAQLY